MEQVSIIIRAKNEAGSIREVLEAIASQSYRSFEIILVDSGSKDDTVSIAEAFGVRVVSIPSESFTFGYALNVGIEKAQSEFVVLLSAHCVPLGNEWLGNLCKNMSKPEIAGVYGKQVPPRDADPMQARTAYTLFGDERRVQRSEYYFSNANALIRKSLWESVPFEESMPYCEDWLWAKSMIGKGYRIVYEPSSAVRHYHDDSIRQCFKRYHDDCLGSMKVTGHIPRVVGLLSTAVIDIFRDAAYIHKNNYALRWMPRAVVFRVICCAGRLAAVYRNKVSR